jgi:hypothetical protein
MVTPGTVLLVPAPAGLAALLAGCGVLGDAGPQSTTHRDNGTLMLDSKSNMPSGGPISYALVVPSINSLVVSGSGNATGDGVAKGDFQVTVSGSGNANLTGLDVPSVAVDMSGSGNLRSPGAPMPSRSTSTVPAATTGKA